MQNSFSKHRASARTLSKLHHDMEPLKVVFRLTYDDYTSCLLGYNTYTLRLAAKLSEISLLWKAYPARHPFSSLRLARAPWK